MFQFFAYGRRYSGSCALLCASLLAVSTCVGTAVGQNTRAEPTSGRAPPGANSWQNRDNMEQLEQAIEQMQNQVARQFGNLPNASTPKKTAHAMEDAATGVTAAIILV